MEFSSLPQGAQDNSVDFVLTGVSPKEVWEFECYGYQLLNKDCFSPYFFERRIAIFCLLQVFSTHLTSRLTTQSFMMSVLIPGSWPVTISTRFTSRRTSQVWECLYSSPVHDRWPFLHIFLPVDKPPRSMRMYSSPVRDQWPFLHVLPENEPPRSMKMPVLIPGRGLVTISTCFQILFCFSIFPVQFSQYYSRVLRILAQALANHTGQL